LASRLSFALRWGVIRRVPALIYAAILIVLAVQVQLAAQTPPTFSVVVTEPAELVEEVGTTRRIGRAEIEARNARTLDEALRLLPGVYIRTGSDGTPRIDIRGFRSRHVLLLINGVQLNSSADGQFDPARISTHAIREIKVSYGSSSVLYGDNALAGVIEITTLDGRADASLDLTAGLPDQWGASGRVARTAGPWSFAVSGTGYRSNGFRLSDSFTPTSTEDGRRRDNSDRERNDARGSVGYAVSPAVSIVTEWSVGAGSYGLPPGTIGDPADVFAQAVRYERVDDFQFASGQAAVTVRPTGRINLRGWVYRNTQREDRSRYDDSTYSSMDDPLVGGTFTTEEHSRVTGSTLLGRVDLQRIGWLRLAVNQRRESFDSSGVIRDVAATTSANSGGGGGRAGGATTTFGVRSIAVDQHVDVYSTGAEWEVRPADRVGVVIGAAANWQQRPGWPSSVQPTWIAGVIFDAPHAVRVHASATRKIRVPSIDQLFSAAAGNPFLRSEHTYGLETGVEHRLGTRSTVGVSGFLTKAYDFIERVSGNLPFENRGDYRFAGGEMTARTAVIRTLDLRGVYSFLDSIDATPAATNRRLQTRPRHRGSLQWAWKPLQNSELRGTASWVGTQLYDARGTAPIQRRADGYALLDVGFTQFVTRRYILAFDVMNVFDRLYEQSYGLPRDGRSVALTLRIRVD
jgi:vitamin B12 transporter